jgi:hypothetical protein
MLILAITSGSNSGANSTPSSSMPGISRMFAETGYKDQMHTKPTFYVRLVCVWCALCMCQVFVNLQFAEPTTGAFHPIGPYRR